MKKIKVHNKSKLQTAKYTDFIELQGDFKVRTEEQTVKLANRIIETGFKYPAYIWIDKDIKWIVDAHGRQSALSHLESIGYEIPEIPFVEITAKNKKEAKKEILYLNSQYGKINLESDFYIENFDIDIDINIEIPGDNIMTLENIEKYEGTDKDFKKEFDKIKDEDAEYPIVQEFMENYNCFVIVTKNDIDETFVRNIFGIDEVVFKNNKGLSNRLTNVISIEMLKRALLKNND